MGTNQDSVSKFWIDCKGTKKTVVAVCFDGASGFKRELLVVHYVNHNFELAKKRKLYVKELKEQLLLSDRASGFKRELLVVHYVNHNF